MRAVIVGASSTGVMTARMLLQRGHEVVIVERDKSEIETLSNELDAGFVCGDGAKPGILRETDPDHTDVLLCLTGNDQTNILASLVGLSLGYPRVVTKIEDPELEHICIELGLEDTIIPARTIGRLLADMSEGQDPLEISTMIRGDARAFSFVADEKDAVSFRDLALPGDTRVVCIYRDDKFITPTSPTQIEPGDEVVLITHRKNLPELRERWGKNLRASPRIAE